MGEPFCKRDVYYKIAPVSNGYIAFIMEFISVIFALYCMSIHESFAFIRDYVSFKSAAFTMGLVLIATIILLGPTGGIWAYGVNCALVVILWYAETIIEQVSGDVQSFLEKHKYQN